MLVSSSAPLPTNSTSPMPESVRARYLFQTGRTQAAVLYAASRYSCFGSAPVSAFQGFGINFQNEVARASSLLNDLSTQLDPLTVQRATSPTGTSEAPKVSPLNPINTNPVAKPTVTQPGPFDIPAWGDMAVQWPGGCTPGTSILAWLQNNPWLALGGLAAVALAGGAFGGAVRRRRAS